MRKKKTSPQLKSQILAMIGEGLSNEEISTALNIDGRVVAIFRRAPNLGEFMKASHQGQKAALSGGGAPASPPAPPPASPPASSPPSLPALNSASAVAPQSAQGPVQSSDGFTFTHSDPLAATGFNMGTQVSYQIYRNVPMDGHLGVQPAPFNVELLGKLYGSGTYTITRLVPGRNPEVSPNVIIGPSAGPPTYPGKDEHDRGFRRENYPRTVRPSFQEQGQDPSAPLDRFARQYVQPQADQSAASAAIKTFGDLALEDRKAAERARASGPDTFLRDFFSEQRERDETRRHEEDQRWQRRMEEDQKKHERDLEKIEKESQARLQAAKQERDAMLALEDKKMEIFKLELKAREDRMREDLARSEKATKEMQESLVTRFDEGRENLQKEHDLRLKMLERETEYRTEMLRVQEKAIKEGGQDAFVGALERLLQEVGNRVHEIVELKKLEAMSPEAQAAAIAKGAINGNLKETPRKPVSPQEKPPVALAGTGIGAGGNGSAKEAENVEQIVRESLAKPELHGVVSEWARQVKSGTTPAMFANMFVEFMRDPEDHKLRKSCSAFANFMASRDWAAMYPVLKPGLSKEEIEIFEKPEAADFYETFRACVIESVNAYWAEFLASREAAQKDAAPAAPEAPVDEKKEATPAIA